MSRRFLRANAILMIVCFVFSVVLVDGAQAPVYASGQVVNTVKQMIQDTGSWVVGNPKGVFKTNGTSNFETWADGAERLVVRDTNGHIMSWGKGNVEHWADGTTKLVVRSSNGQFQGYKEIDQSFWSKLKVKATTPIEGGGANSANFEKGYKFGNEAPKNAVNATKTGLGKLVDGVKNVFSKKTATTTAASTNSTSTVKTSSSSSVDSAKTATNVKASTSSSTSTTASTSKLGAVKKWATTPIEGGGADSANFQKGYKFGNEAPQNVANGVKTGVTKVTTGVKNIFTSKSTTTATTVKPATTSTSNSSSSTSSTVKPSASSTTGTSTISQKVSGFKKWATTPIEGGGANSANFDKGYKFGNEAPAKAVGAVKTGGAKIVGGVKNIFTPKSSTSTTASSSTSAVKPTTTASSNSTVKPSTGSSTSATASTSKLGAIKKWATTPIEGGGADSANFQKGYKFGNEAPQNVANGVKTGVTKVTGGVKKLFTSKTNTTTVEPSSTSTSSTTTNSSSNSTTSSTVKPSTSSSTSTTAPTSKLGALKKWATTPIEGGGADSANFKKGYKFGNETPQKAVDGVKGGVNKLTSSVKKLFTKKAVDGSPSEVNSSQKTKAVKMDETGKVEIENKTAAETKSASKASSETKATETKTAATKTATPAVPSKMSTALKAGGNTLKAAFSPKTMVLAAGITVGFKIVEQIQNGEKVSIGKAVGHLGSGQFIGGFTGAGLGAAAGSVVGSLASGTIPVVGPIIGALCPAIFAHVGGTIGGQLGDGLATGQRPSLKEIVSSMDKGMVLAQSIGSVAGFTLGNMLLPGIGGMVGGILGSIVGSKILNVIRGRKDKMSVGSVNVVGGTVTMSSNNSTSASSVVQNSNSITTSISGTGNKAYDKLMTTYKRYSQHLSNGDVNSSAGMKALKDYKEALSKYNMSK